MNTPSFNLSQISNSASKYSLPFIDNSASSKDENRREEHSVPVSDTIEEVLFDDSAALKMITAQYGVSHLSPVIKKQLFNQIDWLLDSEIWEVEDSRIDQSSFKTLIKFVLNAHPLQAPSLSISHEGCVIANWITGESNKLRLECLKDGHIKWFIACIIDEKVEYATGEAPSLQRLLDAIDPYKAAGWFKRS